MDHQAIGQAGAARAGFSLIECVAVLVLLGVLSFYVTAGLRHTPAAVVAEAGALRAHLRFAQAMAMGNNTADWGVGIHERSYTLMRNGDTAPINWPGQPSPTHAMQGGVRVVAGAGMHAFCQWGCPGNEVVIRLSDGRHEETVRILQHTGLVQ